MGFVNVTNKFEALKQWVKDYAKAENEKLKEDKMELLYIVNQFIIWAKTDSKQMEGIMKKAMDIYNKHQ